VVNFCTKVSLGIFSQKIRVKNIFSFLSITAKFCTKFAIRSRMQKTVLLLLIPFLFTACSKKESINPTPTTDSATHFPGAKALIIIGEKWVLTNKTVDYTNGLPSEDFSNVPDCVKDNIISFARNREFTVDEAVDVCPTKPQNTTFNWVTQDDEQTLVLNNKNWQLVSITNTTMVLKNINKSSSITATTVETYTAQ